MVCAWSTSVEAASKPSEAAAKASFDAEFELKVFIVFALSNYWVAPPVFC